MAKYKRHFLSRQNLLRFGLFVALWQPSQRADGALVSAANQAEFDIAYAAYTECLSDGSMQCWNLHVDPYAIASADVSVTFPTDAVTPGLEAIEIRGLNGYEASISSIFIEDLGNNLSELSGIVVFFPILSGDANGDGRIDVDDLNIMGLNWMQSGKTASEGDFTGDGVVNAVDLNVLGMAWQSDDPGEFELPPDGRIEILDLWFEVDPGFTGDVAEFEVKVERVFTVDLDAAEPTFNAVPEEMVTQADPVPIPVPEPGTLTMLAGVLLGLIPLGRSLRH